MAILQSILVFYACSQGFGTSITLLDEGRLNQIQAVWLSPTRSLASRKTKNGLAGCNKRYIRFDNNISFKMLRTCYLSSTYPTETAQPSFLGYIVSLHRMANSGRVYHIG